MIPSWSKVSAIFHRRSPPCYPNLCLEWDWPARSVGHTKGAQGTRYWCGPTAITQSKMLPKWFVSLAARSRAAIQCGSESGQPLPKPTQKASDNVKLPAARCAPIPESRCWEPRDCKVDECYSAL